jgi:hypothetical protein
LRKSGLGPTLPESDPYPAFMLPRTVPALILLAACASYAAAQTPDDGLLLPNRALSAGVVYGLDSWDQYWEGGLKRRNENIGTLTTQSVTVMGGYGITDRLSVMAMLPYVSTHTSQGTLRGLSGLQDVTFAAKYRVGTTGLTEYGALTAFIVAAAGIPASNYTPDYLPLSIGSASRRASARFTLNFQSKAEWFANATGAHTWRDKVKLDRGAYYTNGQLYMTNEVAMPELFDYTLSAGYRRGRLQLPVSFTQQRTLGGSDIRRQDMPFVSNRMDFTRLDGSVMYALNVPKDVMLRVGAARVLSGRNVGQSTTFTTGLFYAFHF